MTDELPEKAASDLEAFAQANVITPALDREGILRGVRRRRRQRRLAATGGAAVVGLAVLVFVGNSSDVGTYTSERTRVASVRTGQRSAQTRPPQPVGDAQPGKNRVVAEGETAELKLASSRLVMEGPAEFAVAEDRVSVQSGSGRITGTAALSGCGCEASVKGEASFVATTSSLQIVIIAGTAYVAPENEHCDVVQLGASERAGSEEASRDESARTRAGRPSTARNSAKHTRNRRKSECDLGAQADAYRKAMRLRDRDEAGLVSSLRQIRRDYRRCPLSHEVDVALIEALIRSGQTSAAQREARAFVRRYPRSARRAEMERIVSPAKGP